MPVAAQSDPLIFGGPTTSFPVTTKPSTRKPRATKSPSPSTISPTIPSGFVESHQSFVNKVDTISSCFNRSDFSEFSDSDFQIHSAICVQDKYIIQNGDGFCSVQAVNNLSKALKRLGE